MLLPYQDAVIRGHTLQNAPAFSGYSPSLDIPIQNAPAFSGYSPSLDIKKADAIELHRLFSKYARRQY